MENLPDCKKCGQVHRNPSGGASCKAHNARTLKPCRAYPVPGGSVCVTHGGRTQALGQAVTRFRNEQAAEYAVNMLGIVEYDITPTEALLQEVREAAANVAFLRARVQALVGERDLDDPNHPLIWGQTSEKTMMNLGSEGSSFCENLIGLVRSCESSFLYAPSIPWPASG